MADKLVIKIDGDDSNLKKTLSGIGTTAKKGLGVAIKGLAATSAAVAGLSAMAIKGYAEYEQLVGGVDTLFEKSSKTVQKNAANAYKTAGMSANEYMQTATSFAASLKQSFDDTEEGIAKAADVADMAVQDMSDNANKMGTSMELIQTAYQGFAKQNYTMLDNLKLGYGGTKTEMERLLKDAQKISGIKYDISNLSDVYNAIHVIQTELGITGTTAKEAATTIEGSASMMKASFKNLVVGFADENADFDELLDNFIDSVLTFGKNIIPRIKTTFNGVSKFVTKSASKLMPQIVDVVLETIPDLVSAATKLAKALGKALISNLDNIIASVASIIGELVDEITDVAPALKPLGSVIKFAADNFKGLAAAIITGVVAFKSMMIIKSIVSIYQAAVPAITAYTIAIQANQNVSLLLATTMTPLQLAIGVLTGKISLATAAQVAWNAVMNMNPAMLIITGIAALTAAVVGVCVAYDSYIERNSEIVIATQNIANAAADAVQKTQELNDALLSISENAETNIMNAEAEAYANNMLAEELFNLSEKTSLTATEKQRMQIIVDQLNGSVEGLNLLLNNETGQLNMTEEAVKGVIAQKLELAKANAMQELYTEQLKAQYKAETDAMSNAQKLADAQKQYNEILQQGTVYHKKASGEVEIYFNHTREQRKAMDNLSTAIGEYSTALQSSRDAATQSQQDIQALSKVTGTELPESFKTAQEQSQGFFDAILEQTGAVSSQSESKGNDFGQGYVNGINAKKTEAYNAGYNLGLEALRGTQDAQNSNSPAKETIALGEDYGDGYVVGIESKAKDVKNASLNLVVKALAIGLRTGNSAVKKEMKALSETILRSDMERNLSKAKTRAEMEKIIDESNLEILENEREFLIQSQLLKDSELEADKERLEILEENADTEKQIYDSLNGYIEDRINDYIDKLEDIKDAQEDFADSLKTNLYKTVKTDWAVVDGKIVDTGYEVENYRLTDWDAINKDARQYQEKLSKNTDRLKSMFGADEESFNEILAEIRQNDKLLLAVSEASDEDLLKWVQGYQENKKIRQATAEESFADNEFTDLKKSFENEFGTLPDTFFALGEESSQNFAEKFIAGIKSCISQAQQIITQTMNTMFPTAAFAGVGSGNISNSTYSPTYIIQANEGESLNSTINKVKDKETYEKASGGW